MTPILFSHSILPFESRGRIASEHAVSILPERAAEFHEGSEVRAGRPAAQVLERCARTASAEGAQLLLRQVGA
jgi:hypothetical protein